MSRQQAMETDQLAHVIQTIQRARRSGMLEVQRRTGASTIELGTIVFVKGSIVDAHAGQRQGKEAYNLLSQWTRCSFTFTSSNPQEPPLKFPSPPPQLQQMNPALNGKQPEVRAASSPLRQQSIASHESNPSLQALMKSSSAPLSAIPVRLHSAEISIQQIERFGYPRSYRQLCLLIDGYRSIADLSRLLHRLPSDVVKMLADLEKIGSIQIFGLP